MLLFRQLVDPESSTYVYLLADRASREAVLIDPVFEQMRRDAALIDELGLTLRWTLETHVHADHVTAAWLLKQRFGSQIAVGRNSGVIGADRYLGQGDRVAFGGHYLEVRETPGHTAGCVTYVLDDERMAFTGDTVMVRGCGRTDFQEGDARAMYRAVHQQVFTLPDDCLLYPAHDYRGITVTTVAEERRLNPRFGGNLSEGDFIGYMQNLGLPHPKKMDIAVPANLRCGEPAVSQPAQAEPTWAPLAFTFAGFWEIQPQWVDEHLGEVQVVDVREPTEFDGPLGHIPGAQLLPLGTLSQLTSRLAQDRPIVTVCRAGGRSAQATVILQRAGFGKVANLAGGMLRWRAQGLQVEGGSE
jgi:glyoxylase-like metal-dependent hydrolase (beta-lactamase superfamily II)/rhodanese-related sulfurtransferase